MPGREQEARKRSEGNPLQPVRDRVGEGRPQRKADRPAGVQGNEQEARKRPERHALLPVRESCCAAEERTARTGTGTAGLTKAAGPRRERRLKSPVGPHAG